MPDNHAAQFFFGIVKRLVNTGQNGVANGVHFGFKTEDANILINSVFKYPKAGCFIFK